MFFPASVDPVLADAAVQLFVKPAARRARDICLKAFGLNKSSSNSHSTPAAKSKKRKSNKRSSKLQAPTPTSKGKKTALPPAPVELDAIAVVKQCPAATIPTAVSSPNVDAQEETDTADDLALPTIISTVEVASEVAQVEVHHGSEPSFTSGFSYPEPDSSASSSSSTTRVTGPGAPEAVEATRAEAKDASPTRSPAESSPSPSPSPAESTPSPQPPLSSPATSPPPTPSIKDTPAPVQEPPAVQPRDVENDYLTSMVNYIPDPAYIQLVKNVVTLLGVHDARDDEIQFCGGSCGSFNLVKFVDFSWLNLVVKVPFAGVPEHWNNEHAYILQSEAETMKLVYEKTNGNFPIPQVYHYDTGMDNELGAPYIVMERKTGVPLTDYWFDTCRNGTWGFNYPCFQPGSAPMVQLRMNLLRDLAGHMSLLCDIQSDKIGMVTIDENKNRTVGTHVSVNPFTDAITIRGTYETGGEFFAMGVGRRFSWDNRTPEQIGTRTLFGMLLRHGGFIAPAGQKETFTLAHTDLDVQNILCDPSTGKITCILDWENAHFVPRCVGSTSVPLFLRRDWASGYTTLPREDGLFKDMTVSQLEMYRNVYIDTMQEVLGEGSIDAWFTKKSEIRNAVHTTLFPDLNGCSGAAEDVVRKVLRVACPHEDPANVIKMLGEGWHPEVEDVVDEGVQRFWES